jgi:Protein of unknown function (DUF4232)/Ricin-type beta-trefoil lectin domain
MIISVLHRRSPVRGFAVLAAAACSAVLASACSVSSPSGHAAATSSPAPAATSGATASAAPAAATQPGTPAAPAPPGKGPPRCRTGQLAAAFTGLNAAMGGQRGMTLILTNRSSRTCYVYGYEELGFLDNGDSPLPAHLTRVSVPHARVRLRPGANAQAMLTWRAYPDTSHPLEYPLWAEITPPDAHTHLMARWPAEPVRGGDIATWPLSAAPPGPVPTGTGTVEEPFNGMCMAAAGNGSANGIKVVAWKCNHGSSQQWTAYSDGTLRINGKCLDVTGRSTRIGADVELWACDGGPSQQWQISQVSYNTFGPITSAGSGNALADPGGSTANGTQLQMAAYRGDETMQPWHVSFYHYMSE